MHKKELKNIPQADNISYLVNRGKKYYQQRNLSSALDNFQKVIEIDPNNLTSLFLISNIKNEIGDYKTAIKIYKRILTIIPNNLDVQINLCVALFKDGQVIFSRNILDQIVKKFPQNGYAWNNLAKILRESGEISEAISCYKKAIEFSENTAPMESNMLFAYSFSIDYSPEEIAEAHFEWGRSHDNYKQKKMNFKTERNINQRPLRIGYVSPDFRKHAVMFFLKPILENHISNKFKIYCYSDVQTEDNETLFVKNNADHFFNCSSLSNDELANKIEQDKINILVDLAGHSSKNRLLVFAQKPAPVQITYLGYQNTTGLKKIDYFITDNWANPQGDGDHLFSEKILRLSECFLCFRPPENAPKVNEAPLIKNGFITFGVFNNFSRINDWMISTWIKILKKIPDSRIIFQSQPFSDSDFSNQFLNRFNREGIISSRITLYPKGSLDNYFHRHNEVDLILATHPVNGASTICNALWMGTPVLAC